MEKSQLESLINRTEDPVGVCGLSVVDDSESEFVVMYSDEVYHVSSDTNQINNIEPSGQSG